MAARKKSDNDDGRLTDLVNRLCEVQKLPIAEQIKLEQLIRRKNDELKLLQHKNTELLRQHEAMQDRMDFLVGLKKPGNAKRWAVPKRVRGGQACAVYLLSDVHCEELVEPQEVNGLNEHNLQVSDRSLKQTFERKLLLTEDARGLVNIRQAVLWLGGDMISGHIHDELRERNLLTPLAACRWVKERILAGMQLLYDNGGFDNLTIVTSYGNHGRDTPKNRSAGEKDHSYEHDMYLELRDATSGWKRLKWQVGEGYMTYLDVLGKVCRFHHGHKVKFGGGVGGLTVPLYKSVYAWNQKIQADVNFSGHFHTFGFPRMDVVTNGSVIGYNSFAVDIKADYQPPLQTFAVIDKDRGLTRVLPVFCR